MAAANLLRAARIEVIEPGMWKSLTGGSPTRIVSRGSRHRDDGRTMSDLLAGADPIRTLNTGTREGVNPRDRLRDTALQARERGSADGRVAG